MKGVVLMLSMFVLAVACAPRANPVTQSPKSPPPRPSGGGAQPGDIFVKARALGRGVNLGNALEAPREGAWGVTLRDEDFALVAEAGFDHVRVPIRWSAHAEAQAPFTIDQGFAERVDWVVDRALASGLKVIVNVHHYEEIMKEPEAHSARLAGLWQQISERYANDSDNVYFELLNEPNEALSIEKNNRLISDLLAVVRKTNPHRAVIVGSVHWNAIRGLPGLELPVSDQNLIVTFHYYEPFDFTHQGAPWVNKVEQVGVDWPGAVGDAAKIAADFDQAVAWAEEHHRPLYLGEFGAFQAAEMGARVRWTSEVVRQTQNRGLAFAYWELRSGFGLYDLQQRAWRQPLLEAVLKTTASNTQ